MLEKYDILSKNQTADQIKQKEAWKAGNNQNDPNNLKKERRTEK